MKILGISSATKVISVGLVNGNTILSELTLSGKEAFTENLIVYIKKIIDGSGINPEGIAVTEGPGSYSGLRGGITTAKTLAQVLKIKVVGISTLETIAYNMIDYDGTCAAITHARSNEYNFALFGTANHKLKRLTDDLIIPFDKLIAKLSQINRILTLCGEAEKVFDELKKRRPDTKISAALNNIPRGVSAAFLGAFLFKALSRNGHLKLCPKYSHQPNIREFKFSK